MTNFIFGYCFCGLIYACLYDLFIRPTFPDDGFQEEFNKISVRISLSIFYVFFWLPVIAMNIYYGIVGPNGRK